MLKKFDDILTYLDKIHQRDGRTDGPTDGQTPGDSKDRAYTSRRAVINEINILKRMSGIVIL